MDTKLDISNIPLQEKEFYRCVVGSTVNGIGIGTGDIDLMGIRIERPDQIVGLGHFEQWSKRSQPEGIPNGPGDYDITVYGLRMFLRLAVKSNPSILTLLFVPEQFRVVDSEIAQGLRDLAPWIVSREAAKTHLGYMAAQKARLLGERGGRRTNRVKDGSAPDWKYASHLIRLGIQGVELLTSGRITLPMPENDRKYCVAIRKGEVPLEDVLTRSGLLEAELKDLETESPLLESPDLDAVNEFLFETYTKAWQ